MARRRSYTLETVQQRFHKALARRDVAKADGLLQKGADVNELGRYQESPLQFAMMPGSNAEILAWLGSKNLDWEKAVAAFPQVFRLLRERGEEKDASFIWKQLDTERMITYLEHLHHQERREAEEDEEYGGSDIYRPYSAAEAAGAWIREALLQSGAGSPESYVRLLVGREVLDANALWDQLIHLVGNAEAEKAFVQIEKTCPVPVGRAWAAFDFKWSTSNPPSDWLMEKLERDAKSGADAPILSYKAQNLLQVLCHSGKNAPDRLEAFCLAARERPDLLKFLQRLAGANLRGLYASSACMEVWHKHIRPHPLSKMDRDGLSQVINSASLRVLRRVFQENPGPYLQKHALFNAPGQVARGWPAKTLPKALAIAEKAGFNLELKHYDIDKVLKGRGLIALVQRRIAQKQNAALESAVAKPKAAMRSRM